MVASSEEIAWLAGILDGEGSFLLNRSIVGGKVYLYPKITVNMTDLDVMERVADLFGTSTYVLPKKEDRKQAWRASIQGAGAVSLMRLLRPWMSERRGEKIDELVAYWEARSSARAQRSDSMKRVVATRRRDAMGRLIA